MPRPPRYLPEGGGLVEVTNRTIQEHFFLKATRSLNVKTSKRPIKTAHVFNS